MFRYIEKLQKQPEHIRRMTLFGSVGVIMTVIVIIWFSTFGARISSSVAGGVAGVKNEDNNNGALPPLSVIKEQSSRFYNELLGNVDSIKKEFR